MSSLVRGAYVPHFIFAGKSWKAFYCADHVGEGAKSQRCSNTRTTSIVASGFGCCSDLLCQQNVRHLPRCMLTHEIARRVNRRHFSDYLFSQILLLSPSLSLPVTLQWQWFILHLPLQCHQASLQLVHCKHDWSWHRTEAKGHARVGGWDREFYIPGKAINVLLAGWELQNLWETKKYLFPPVTACVWESYWVTSAETHVTLHPALHFRWQNDLAVAN